MRTGQIKLIVKNVIVLLRPVLDWLVTFGSPPALTADGALGSYRIKLGCTNGAHLTSFSLVDILDHDCA